MARLTGTYRNLCDAAKVGRLIEPQYIVFRHLLAAREQGVIDFIPKLRQLPDQLSLLLRPGVTPVDIDSMLIPEPSAPLKSKESL